MKRELIVNDIFFNEYNKGEPGRIDGKRTIKYSGPGEKDIYKIKGTRGWRNNNPGNIVCGTFSKGEGAIGCDGIFAIFSDIETGDRAQSTLLRGGAYKNKSIKEVIKIYSPPEGGNPTEKYIQYVTEKSGLPENKKIKDMTDDEFKRFRGAMKKFENTTPGKTKSGADKPLFVPGRFQTKKQGASSGDRFAKSKSSSADVSRTDKKSRPARSRAYKSSACEETLAREGKRVVRKEADCGTRGSFIS
ncbi:MAG TPA: hypothetical protein ENI77_10140 [Nitrospirae bacterium]|nr:hypothetical protein [Nitrospirota bacterium]